MESLIYEGFNEHILYSIMYQGKWIAYSLDDDFIYLRLNRFMVKIPLDKFYIDKRYLNQTTGLIPLFKKEYTDELIIEGTLVYNDSFGYLVKLSNDSYISTLIFDLFRETGKKMKCYEAGKGKVAICLDNELIGFIDTVEVKND